MINNQLDSLFREWKQAMKQNGDNGFCYDGLIRHNGQEDTLWLNSKRRIVFLLKEQNDNDGEDVREWSGSINGYTPNGNFFNRLSAWLYGLTHVAKDGYPPIEEAFNSQTQMKVLREYPYAYVNVKKETGTATADDNVIWQHGVRYAPFIRRELDILNGNIVVCGGNIVFKLAKDVIYKDIPFKMVNDWVYLAKDRDMVLIHSFHPTARKSNEEMYEGMMENMKKNY